MNTTNDTLHVPAQRADRGITLRRMSRDAFDVLARWRRGTVTRPDAAVNTPLPEEVDEDLTAWARASAARNGFADGGIDEQD